MAGCGRGAPNHPLDGVVFEEQATNVLILLLDDLGTDQVSSWQEHPEAPATPTLDGLGDLGVRFRNAYSAPVCSPARAALLTGRHARHTGLGDLIETGSDDALSLDHTLLPELLAEADPAWRTAAIGKWHLAGAAADGWRSHALDHGFDAARLTPGNLGEAYVAANEPLDYSRWERLDDGALSVDDRYATTAQVDDALAWIDETRGPWLAYVAFSAAHAPFHAPPRALLDEPVAAGDPAADRYAAMVRALDRELGRLLSELDPEVLSRTMILVMGDNGTPGEVVRPPWDGQRAKYTLYEGGTNVPLIVAGAGVADRGAWSPALVHVVDLLPTVAEVAGVDPGAVDGLSLQPLLADAGASWGRDIVFTEHFGPNGPGLWAREEVAARDARYKRIEIRVGGVLTSAELFDLEGRHDDGPDLLAAGPLDAGALAANDRLEEAIQTFRSAP